jgi:hypothetical protein
MLEVCGARHAAACVGILGILGILGCADRAPPARWQQPEPPTLARPLESAIVTPEEATEGSTGPSSELEESAPAADSTSSVLPEGDGDARSGRDGMW